MTTKTFSGRADADALALANALTQAEHKMSFGQYCGSVLIDAICQRRQLPTWPQDADWQERRNEARAFICGFADRPHDSAIAAMSDDEIRDLIASHYE